MSIDTACELITLPIPPYPPAIALTPGPSIDLIGLICTGLKPQSAAGYLKDYTAFARFTGDPSPTIALVRLLGLERGPAHTLVLAYQAEMDARALSPATIARRLAALVRAARRARKVGLSDLVLEPEPPKAESLRDTSGPGKKGWGRMLARAIADAEVGTPASVRNLAILLLLHDRALRRGEVAGLDLPEDLDATRPAVQVLGKGKRCKEWLTVNDRTRLAIERWVRIRGDLAGPLFTRCDRAAVAGDPPVRLDGESINRLVKALADAAGLGRTVRAHGLRHQSITQALDDGWDVREVKHFSRHAKVDTVLIYDDNRKDVGGDITRAIGGSARPRRRARPGAGK